MKEKLIENPIHLNQHGFCTDKSTESAISDTQTILENNTTPNKNVIIVSLDIQAAFDSVTPSSIKNALIKHGSNTEYANWYDNHLTHRDLTTELKGETYRVKVKFVEKTLPSIFNPYMAEIVLE